MSDDPVSSPFTCANCGHSLGDDALRCPKRREGDCFYRKRSFRRTNFAWYAALMILGGIVIDLTIWTLESEFSLGYYLFIAVGVAPIGLGLILFTHRRTWLIDPASGEMWCQDTILGRSLQRQLVSKGKLLEFDLEPLPPNSYPASTIKLYYGRSREMYLAVRVFRAAIASLLAEGFVRIYRHRSYLAPSSKKGRVDTTVFVARVTERAKSAEPYGALEQAIVEVLNAWSKNAEARDWPLGTPIYYLVRAVLRRNHSAPAQYVFSLVIKHNSKLGHGHGSGFPERRSGVVLGEGETVPTMLEQVNELIYEMERSQPDFSRACVREIERGLESRETIDD